jgi:predicted DNA-binding WGR domain protein
MKYQFIGWCSDGVHDKVWVCIQLSGDRHGKFLTVWGRRGKKLQSKIVESTTYEMGKLARSKDAKGYVEIPKDKLNEVYTDFQQDLEKTTAWELLKI